MEEKKQIEKLLVEGFRTLYPAFPKGKIVSSESPDFVVRTGNNHYIGIELTRLHPPYSGNNQEETGMKQKTEESVVARALEIFRFSSDQPMFVKWLFADDMVIDEGHALSFAAKTVQVIRKTIAGNNLKDFSSLLIPPENLPAGLQSLLIIYHPDLQVPVWERANKLGISDDIITDLRFSIQKKDEKLRLYHKRKLHLYWLLVIADRLEGISSFSIEDKIRNHEFTSRFQHVFLYELMRERVFRLV